MVGGHTSFNLWKVSAWNFLYFCSLAFVSKCMVNPETVGQEVQFYVQETIQRVNTFVLQ